MGNSALRARYDQYDKDGNGRIDLSEFSALLDALGSAMRKRRSSGVHGVGCRPERPDRLHRVQQVVARGLTRLAFGRAAPKTKKVALRRRRLAVIDGAALGLPLWTALDQVEPTAAEPAAAGVPRSFLFQVPVGVLAGV